MINGDDSLHLLFEASGSDVIKMILKCFEELETKGKDSFQDKEQFEKVIEETLTGSLGKQLLPFLRKVSTDIHWCVLQYFSAHHETHLATLSAYHDDDVFCKALENLFYAPNPPITLFKIAYERVQSNADPRWLPSSFSIDFVGKNESHSGHTHLPLHFDVPSFKVTEVRRKGIQACKNSKLQSWFTLIFGQLVKTYAAEYNIKIVEAATGLVNSFARSDELDLSPTTHVEEYAKLFLFVQMLSSKVRHLYYFALPIQYGHPGPAILVATCKPLARESLFAVYSLVLLIVGSSQFTETNLEKRLVQTHARKSAVAAVMSRNMSHNIGSHVLARLTNKSESKQQKDGNRGQPSRGENAFAVFHSYLKTRMDFLADISTAVPFVTIPSAFYQDVMLYFSPEATDKSNGKGTAQLVLLDLISGDERVRQANISLVYKNQGKPISLAKPENDFVFACPNGSLGHQALFVLLENVIRNSTKHGISQLAENGHQLKITLEVEEDPTYEDLLKVCLYDNLKNAQTKLAVRNADKEHQVCLHEYLDGKIRDPIIDESGKLRQEAWGVLEMKIAAAYLRKIPQEGIDREIEPPILKAVNRDGNLGYEFYLLKPREIMILDPDGTIKLTKGVEEQTRRSLASAGIKLCSIAGEVDRVRQAVIDHNYLMIIGTGDDKKVPFYPVPSHIYSISDSSELQGLVKSLENGDQLAIQRLLLFPRAALLNSNPQVNPHLLLHSVETEADRPTTFDVDGLCTTIGSWAKHFRGEDANTKYVVYDRHGDGIATFTKLDKNDILIKKQNFLFLEPFRQVQPIAYLLENFPTGNAQSPNGERHAIAKKRLVLELIEAGLTKVVILDERIQGFLKNTVSFKDSTNTYYDLATVFDWMNIYVPSKPNEQRGNGDDALRIDLDNPRGYEQQIRNWLDQKISGIDDFLVVHLGVLEKLFENKEDRIVEWIENYEQKANLVIISGRGVPPLVRRLGKRFVHYSQISRYLIEERSKFHFTKVLHSARRPL
jgi:hypothetical protein